MLSYSVLKQTTINQCKNGFYFDYYLRRLVKLFVYNVYNNLAFVFAEKYMLEYTTKYVFNYMTYKWYNGITLISNYKMLALLLVFTVNTALLIF